MNVDFTNEILSELDTEAKRLNISRQAVIKTMVSDALDRRTAPEVERKHLVFKLDPARFFFLSAVKVVFRFCYFA